MSRYDAYILRFWRSSGTDGPQWTCKLVHLGEGETAQFDDLEALLEHIRTIVGEVSDRDGTAAARPSSADESG